MASASETGGQALSHALFEAFFWIEPVKASSDAPTFTSTRVVFHYPPNVAHITTPFRDLPQFCFPDLERVALQAPAEGVGQNEFFTFTLTEGDGSRVYGVCMRPFFRGEGLRYDVRRRARHCLCLVTRRPLHALLRTVLLQLHGLTLLDETRPGSSALAFLKALYAADQGLPCVRVPLDALPRSFLVALPRYQGTADTTAPLLPLLLVLGAEQFFLLLSALLCERRVLFVADDLAALSQSVLAAASMVQPFAWQHIFVPLLPSGLLDYAQAPMPFLLGVRRYQLPLLERMGAALSDCVVVDVDRGSLRPVGRVSLVDFVGDRGSALKQASEQVDGLVKAGALMVRGLMGQPAAKEPHGPRDLVVAVLGDVNRLLERRPGGEADTLRGVAQGLLGAAAKTLGAGALLGERAEARLQWQTEGERALREALLLFFCGLFCDLPDFLRRAPAGQGQGQFTSWSLDHAGFLARRQQAGDSRELLELLGQVRGSQMLERHCERLAGPGPGPGPAAETQDAFSAVCRELRRRRLPPSVANVRAAIQAVRDERGGAGDTHAPLLQLTDGRAEGAEQRQLWERVLADSFSSDALQQVLKAASYRLEACDAAGGRGAAGQAGLRTLSLLQRLLVQGPHAVLSGCLDLVPVLRAMVRGGRKWGGLGLGAALSAIRGAIGAAGAMAGGAGGDASLGDDLREASRATLLLLLDHQRLQHQRRFSELARAGKLPYLQAPAQRAQLAPLQDFASMHAGLCPPGQAHSAAPLRLAPTVFAAEAQVHLAPRARPASPYGSLPPAPASPARFVPEASTRQRMEAIYARHLPGKLQDVPALLAKYRGREAEVLRLLEDRYGREPVVINGVALGMAPLGPAQPDSQPESPAARHGLHPLTLTLTESPAARHGLAPPKCQSAPAVSPNPDPNPNPKGQSAPAVSGDSDLLSLAAPPPNHNPNPNPNHSDLLSLAAPPPNPNPNPAPSNPFSSASVPPFPLPLAPEPVLTPAAVPAEPPPAAPLDQFSANPNPKLDQFSGLGLAPLDHFSGPISPNHVPMLSPQPATPSAPVIFRGDIPAQFRVVDRDTGVVTDLRLLGGGGVPIGPAIPAQFRMVDRDTGEVTDIRNIGALPALSGPRSAAQTAWRPAAAAPNPNPNTNPNPNPNPNPNAWRSSAAAPALGMPGRAGSAGVAFMPTSAPQPPRDPFADLGVLRK